MSYVDRGERAHVDHTAHIDMVDHLERYRFASQFARGSTVLDIACGTGYGSGLLKKSGATSVIGVDVSAEAVAEARRLNPNSTFLVGSMIDFDGGPFDRIVSFETIEHIDDYKAALGNLRRLLKPGGILILSTPNRPVNSPECKTIADKPRCVFHIREFNVEEMSDALAEAGFQNIERYGQKQRWILQARPAALAYAAMAYVGLFRNHYSARVLPLAPGLQPRYTVYVAPDSANVRVTSSRPT